MLIKTQPCPCDSCNRWSECNGVDTENCPVYQAWADREKKNRQTALEILLDNKTESGLIEEA